MQESTSMCYYLFEAIAHWFPGNEMEWKPNAFHISAHFDTENLKTQIEILIAIEIID